MKTIELIRCKRCGAQYYAGKHNLILEAGTNEKDPDDIDFIINSVAKCSTCKQKIDRTIGGSNNKNKI